MSTSYNFTYWFQKQSNLTSRISSLTLKNQSSTTSGYQKRSIPPYRLARTKTKTNNLKEINKIYKILYEFLSRGRPKL